MKVEIKPPDSDKEPRLWVQREQTIAMVLQPGSIEWGSRSSEFHRVDYLAGDLGICLRHAGEWVGTVGAPSLLVSISDAALMATNDRISGEVELRHYRKLVDSRLRGLVEAVNAERLAGFPSGKLFLDSIEQALAIALVDGYSTQSRQRQVRIYQGGLGAARLRRINDLVVEKLDDELSLVELAQSVDLSTAHFARMFRKSTGETPHKFVQRHRIARAKEMLRAAESRILDVAVACGFKTQQHFAQVFRNTCGTTPTEYRQEFLARDSISS